MKQSSFLMLVSAALIAWAGAASAASMKQPAETGRPAPEVSASEAYVAHGGGLFGDGSVGSGQKGEAYDYSHRLDYHGGFQR